jgi:hypothetical protein
MANAKCLCGKVMKPNNSGCKFTHLLDSTGKEYKRIKYGSLSEDCGSPDCCHDCNVKVGGVHHEGCDMERCPKCGGQLLSCECDIVKLVKYERVKA